MTNGQDAPARPSFLERLDPTFWPRVQEYLCRSRCLDPAILAAGFRQRILGAAGKENRRTIATNETRLTKSPQRKRNSAGQIFSVRAK